MIAISRVRRWLVGLTLLGIALVPRVARAQAADESIAKAIAAYENLDVAAALRTFAQVVSPTSPFPVTEEQRVTAYKYMGAAWASSGKPDSASIYFQAAILRNPFTDLDPNKFTPQELAAFGLARQSVFKIGANLRRDSIIAGSGHNFQIQTVTSHGGRLVVQVQLQRPDSVTRPTTLFSSDGVEGARDISWNGTVAGVVVPAGTYELTVIGESQVGEAAKQQKKDSTKITFEIRWLHEDLEGAIRDLKADELLPERASSVTPWADLGKGLVVAGVAFVLPTALGNGSKVGATVGTAAVAAGLGAAIGIASFISRTNNKQITENVVENNRRRNARQGLNNERAARNDARLNAKTLLLVPTGGR